MDVLGFHLATIRVGLLEPRLQLARNFLYQWRISGASIPTKRI